MSATKKEAPTPHDELLGAAKALTPLGSNGIVDVVWGYARRLGKHRDAELLTTLSNALRAAIAKTEAKKWSA